MLGIYGAGGFAREVAWLAEQQDRAATIVAFIDDDPVRHGRLMNDVPIMSFDEFLSRYPAAKVALSLGAPKVREELASRVQAAGVRLESLIHPRVERSRWVTMGEGVVICAGTVITTNVAIADGVQVNLNCTIGHDAELEEFATLAPGVHVSGNVRIGARAYLGTGAVVINGTSTKPLVIGHDAVVGAGACVTRDVLPGATVVGVPARPKGGQ